MNDRLPRTVDGHGIYPGMEVFVMVPFSIEGVVKATIYCVIGDGSGKLPDTPYWCVFEENRYYNGEWWEDGNTESTSRVFADEAACRVAVKLIESKRRGRR